MKGIRLTDSQVLIICKIFRSHFLENDHLWIFGSRVDLNKRGGVYIETTMSTKDANKARIKFLADLEMELGEQKIDVVLKIGDFSLPIYVVAKKEGVKLL